MFKWSALTGAAGCILLSSVAWAQERAPSPDAIDPAPGEGIVVTGSRLKRNGSQTPTPVTTIGSELLEQRSSTNVADTLNEMPAFRPSASPSASTQSIFSGASLADLRGLGASRTLVLINGQRAVSSNTAGNVDLNLVPISLIERTDVVTGGASAAYGSDAVAGVVNLVLKRLNGFGGNIQSGITQYGDNRQLMGSLNYGTHFAQGRGHISIAGEYSKVDGVRFQNSRDWYASAALITNPAYTATNGQAQRLIATNVHSSVATYNGLINSGVLRGTEFLPGGGTEAFTYGSSVGSSYMVGGSGVNVSAQRPLSYPLERSTIYVRPEFEVSDAFKLSADLTWSRSQTGGESFAFPYNSLTIQADNAYLPADLRSALVAAGQTSFTMGRYTRDLGTSNATTTNNTYRGVLSASGKLGGSWSWSSYYQYGRTTSHSLTTGIFNSANLTRALDAVVNPATGAIVCRSTLTDPANGCAPLNLFGEGSASAAAKAYVNGVGDSTLTIAQHAAAATVQGDLFSTWAGPVSSAFGVEYRRESARRVSDPISAVNGFNTGNLVPINGNYTVKEAFAEIGVPLAKDVRFAKSLDLNGAVRFTDYSTSGSVTTWKIGGSYAPSSDLRFRGTVSRDIRAPNIGELYSATSSSFFTAIDPTRGNAQSFTQQLLTGNTGLKPEKSDMFTGGLVLTPTFLRAFSLSVDYYDIRIKDAITSITAQQTIDRCSAGQTALCSLITRTSAGVISSVNIRQLNYASVKTNGVDIEAQYRLRPTSGTSLTLSALASYIANLTTDDGVTVLQQAGVVGTDFGSSPHWRATGSVTYDGGPYTLFVQGRWVGGGLYNPVYSGNGVDNNKVNGQFLVNLSAETRVRTSGGTVSLYATVNNLFNAAPPLDPGTFVYAAQTNQVLYDVFGRSFTVGARFHF